MSSTKESEESYLNRQRIAKYFTLYQIFLLSMTINLTNAEICAYFDQDNGQDPAYRNGTRTFQYPSKVCPDFKDQLDQHACCPSKISERDFFCCTAEYKAEIDAQLAAEARGKFIISQIPLVLCVMAFLLSVLLIHSFFSRRCRYDSLCNWNRRYSSPPSMAQPYPATERRWRWQRRLKFW
jgi:hypothetical protein